MFLYISNYCVKENERDVDDVSWTSCGVWSQLVAQILKAQFLFGNFHLSFLAGKSLTIQASMPS